MREVNGIKIYRNTFYDVLLQFQEEPSNHFRPISITSLEYFIKGYMRLGKWGIIGDTSLVYEEDDPSFAEFTYWVQGKEYPQLSSGIPFSEYLLKQTNGDEEAAFHLFFERLDEFKQLNKKPERKASKLRYMIILMQERPDYSEFVRWYVGNMKITGSVLDLLIDRFLEESGGDEGKSIDCLQSKYGEFRKEKEEFPKGKKLQGMVKRHAPFGFFVDVNHPKITGLVEITSIVTPDDRRISEKDYPKVGKSIEVEVIALTEGHSNQVWLKWIYEE